MKKSLETKIIRAYRQGYFAREIAVKAGVTYEAVLKIILKFNNNSGVL
jgi:hypothetical protein